VGSRSGGGQGAKKGVGELFCGAPTRPTQAVNGGAAHAGNLAGRREGRLASRAHLGRFEFRSFQRSPWLSRGWARRFQADGLGKALCLFPVCGS
jgi:hypothetical protein